jgi:solute carrier family 30 (zinc transporter), member 1
MIASVHIKVNLPKQERIKRYHSIARAIRTCLHAYGIHSSTIQPEFAPDAFEVPSGSNQLQPSGAGEENTPLLQDATAKGCMFECVGGGECEDNRCCDTGVKNGKSVNTTGYGTGGGS